MAARKKYPFVSIYPEPRPAGGTRYVVAFRIPGGKRRFIRVRTAETAERTAAEKSKLIEQVKAGLVDPADVRYQQYAQVELLGRRGHLAAWRRELRQLKRSRTHVKQSYRRVRRLLKLAKIERIPDLTTAAIG